MLCCLKAVCIPNTHMDKYTPVSCYAKNITSANIQESPFSSDLINLDNLKRNRENGERSGAHFQAKTDGAFNPEGSSKDYSHNRHETRV